MAKKALLIGVSEYLPGLNPLPAAEQDVREMQRVLEHPEIGGFDEIHPMSNPSAQEMRIAIETLFTTCSRDDLVLLYFSGHGITDDNSRFYFASCDTHKTDQGLIRSTAVSAAAVHDFMEDSRSKRKVVILDCCYSGAFAKGMTAKTLMDAVEIQKQLGGEGRAVLTSSTSTQYSFEQKGSDLSIYTRYLIEGLETGSADCDEDGAISAEDLHAYAKQKVQETTIAMKPEIYVSREGFKIFLAQAPIADPATRFRREVERLARQGQIPDIHGDIPDVLLTALDAKSRSLGLLPQDAETIMTEVLKPYRDHKRNLRTYERHLRATIADDQPLRTDQRLHLRYLQQSLELTNEDVEWVEQRVLQPSTSPSVELTEPIPSQNRPVAIDHSAKSISAESTNPSEAQLTTNSRRLTPVLEDWRGRSLFLKSILISVGGATVLLVILRLGVLLRQPNQIESVEACVSKDYPIDLFDKPEGSLTGFFLMPNSRVTLTEQREQGKLSTNTWVYVMSNDPEKTGWTFESNFAPCYP